MTSLRLALSELRRLTAGRMPKLAVLAIVLIPTMYASLYLWANHDPYGRLASVQAAVVVDDVPAESANSGSIHAGQDVAADLIKDGSFDWQQVSAEQASSGVRDGRYLFALTIPEGFSQALADTADFEPRKAQLILTTNEANNYLSATIAEQVITRVSGSIAQHVSERAASSFLLGFATLHDQLKHAADGATELADGLTEAQDGAGKLATGAQTLAAGNRRLLKGQQALGAGLTKANRGAQKLASGADQVADGNAQLARIADRIAAISKQAHGDLDRVREQIVTQLAASGLSPQQQAEIIAILDQLRQPLDGLNDRVQATDAQIDRLANGAGQVAAGNAQLVRGLHTARAGSARLQAGQQQAARGAAKLANGAERLATGLEPAQAGANRLANGLSDGVASIPDLNEQRRTDTAKAIASPLTTRDVTQAEVTSYGAGLAPLFLAIGAWVGGYVMFLLVRPLSNRAIAARQSPWRIALGGWLTPALLASTQVSIMLGVVMAVVGIDVTRAAQVVLFLILVATAFVAIVHCLNAWLGPVGQLLGLVLLVLQLASAGGTFPWQTLPPTLQVVHGFLPMSYAVDGIRHLMYGASLEGLPSNIGVLLAYLIASVALSSLAAYRRRIWRVSQIKPEIAL